MTSGFIPKSKLYSFKILMHLEFNCIFCQILQITSVVKLMFYHHLLTLMSFQTFLLNTKGELLEFKILSELSL